MDTSPKPTRRWLFLGGYLMIVMSMLACMAIGLGSSNVESGTVQIENGAVEVMNPSGEWSSVAGASTFELVGVLTSTEPWGVAGKSFETNESTQIEQGLQVGDLVRVRGTILEDGKWMAYSIERAQEAANTTIIIIGQVTSIDPWVVSGITLNVTTDTVITGNITVGMLVRVEILLLEDGTWQVLSIALLGDFTEIEGCITVVATIISVTAEEIQFVGWPSLPLSPDVRIESGDDLPLRPDQDVLVVLCPSDDNQIVIIQIIVIIIDVPDDDEEETPGEGEKVLVCHKPSKKSAHTLSLPRSAVPAHLGHGDKLGPCP